MNQQQLESDTNLESLQQKRIELYKLFLVRVYQQFSIMQELNATHLFEGIDLPLDIKANIQNNTEALPLDMNPFLRRATSFFSYKDFTEEDISSKTMDENSNIFDVINDILKIEKSFTKESLAEILFKVINEFPEESIRKVLLRLFPSAEVIVNLINLQSPTLKEQIISQFLTQAFMLFIAFKYNVRPSSYELGELLKGEDSEYLRKKKELAENTIEHVVEIKSKELPPPSPELRFSLQIPAYNELPLRATEITRRGNISDQLMSIINAAELYEQSGGSMSEIEILINVNNTDDKSFTLAGEEHKGTLNNYFTLKLIELINNVELDVEKVLEMLTKELMFLDRESKDYELLIKYYKNLISKAKSAVANGLRLHAIDCTDGTYISRKDENSPILNSPNQASRRLLLSEIATNRFKDATTQQDQLHIFLDADIRLSRSYFVSLREKFNKGRNAPPKAILLPLRVVPPETYDVDSGSTHIDRTKAREITQAYREYFYYRDFMSAAGTILNKHIEEEGNLLPRPLLKLVKRTKRIEEGSHHFTPFLETIVVNNAAHLQGGNWGLYGSDSKGGNEDSNYYLSLSHNNVPFDYLSNHLTSRVHRMRPESWGGRISTWKKENRLELTFRKITYTASIAAVNFIEKRSGIKYPDDVNNITPKQFVGYLIEVLNSIKNLTLKERQILLKHGLLKSNKYRGLNDISFNRQLYGDEFALDLFRLISLCRDLNQMNNLLDYPNISLIISEISSFAVKEFDKSRVEGSLGEAGTDPVTLKAT